MNYQAMPSNASDKVDLRYSKISDLDREAVRELCELHPWELGRLSAEVGMERTALSHFFAGRRLFPQKYAAKFLRLIGLTLKSQPDRRHGFWIEVRPGLEDLAAKWIARLFPNGGKMFQLSNAGADVYHPQLPKEQWLFATVLYDGVTAALLRKQFPDEDLSWIPGEWEESDYSEFEGETLLGLDHQPTKADIVEVVQRVSTPDWEDVMWAEIKSTAAHYGVSADKVFEILKSAIPGYKEAELEGGYENLPAGGLFGLIREQRKAKDAEALHPASQPGEQKG